MTVEEEHKFNYLGSHMSMARCVSSPSSVEDSEQHHRFQHNRLFCDHFGPQVFRSIRESKLDCEWYCTSSGLSRTHKSSVGPTKACQQFPYCTMIQSPRHKTMFLFMSFEEQPTWLGASTPQDAGTCSVPTGGQTVSLGSAGHLPRLR